MDVAKAVTTRRSIRKFKEDVVPESLIREILEDARGTPSWGGRKEFLMKQGQFL